MKRAPSLRHGIFISLAFCYVLALSVIARASPHGEISNDLVRKVTMLIKEIKKDVVLTGTPEIEPKVYESIRRTLRHKFVIAKHEAQAYGNYPLPIGYGQTISQPFIVALMTNLLKTEAHHKVLEVGTGSGYQAAVLSPLVKEVHTVEIIKELATSAKARLEELNYKNVKVYSQDGYDGIKKEAPFDGIIVTAAASHIPPPLIEQLKVGGRMVIPVGTPFQVQNLVLLEKTSDKKDGLIIKDVLPVRFVPFTGSRSHEPSTK